MSQGAHRPTTLFGRVINEIEETLIALILAAMTLITFVNVVMRYVFNGNVLWALESTVFLFAWLVLIGASYCVKVNAHLGVDAVVRLFPKHLQKAVTVLAVLCCIVFATLLLIGSWNYWAPFAGLPSLDELFNLAGAAILGAERWTELGGTVVQKWRDNAWYEVNDIPMPAFLRFLEDAINQGEAYEKLPRVIPYAVLPLGMLLLLMRFVEAGWKVATGRTDLIIAAHEAEEAAAEVAAPVEPNGGRN